MTVLVDVGGLGLILVLLHWMQFLLLSSSPLFAQPSPQPPPCHRPEMASISFHTSPSPSSPSTTISSSHININPSPSISPPTYYQPLLLNNSPTPTNPLSALRQQQQQQSDIYPPPPSLQHTPSKPIHFLLNPVHHKFLTQIPSATTVHSNPREGTIYDPSHQPPNARYLQVNPLPALKSAKKETSNPATAQEGTRP